MGRNGFRRVFTRPWCRFRTHWLRFWAKPDAAGRIPYKNRIPWEIVNVFERHGFVWGGKWYHYDTMHFEYRPELVKTGHSVGR